MADRSRQPGSYYSLSVPVSDELLVMIERANAARTDFESADDELVRASNRVAENPLRKWRRERVLRAEYDVAAKRRSEAEQLHRETHNAVVGNSEYMEAGRQHILDSRNRFADQVARDHAEQQAESEQYRSSMPASYDPEYSRRFTSES